MENRLDKRKIKAISGIFVILFGILVLPFLVKELYDIDPVKTSFVVIIIYFFFDRYMKRK